MAYIYLSLINQKKIVYTFFLKKKSVIFIYFFFIFKIYCDNVYIHVFNTIENHTRVTCILCTIICKSYFLLREINRQQNYFISSFNFTILIVWLTTNFYYNMKYKKLQIIKRTHYTYACMYIL